MGITHHSNYVRIMEEARVDFLDKIGYGFDRIEAEGVVSPVIAISCSYKHPTTFKDLIEVEVAISSMQDLKFEFTYTMRCAGKVVCLGQSTHCFMENGRPVIIARRLPELYQSLQNNIVQG